METPADEQVKKHGATALLFLLLSLLAAGPNWGAAQSAAGYPGANEAESRCAAAVQRATAEKSKPDKAPLPLDCIAGGTAAFEAVSSTPVPASFGHSVQASEPQRHQYQARAPPAV